MKHHLSDELIKIGEETRRIMQAGSYECQGTEVKLPEAQKSAQAILVDAAAAAGADVPAGKCDTSYWIGNVGTFEAVSLLGLPAETTAVHNFANAVHPGGGFLEGAPAQEEDLCRKSTLYSSLTSAEAAPYYARNRAVKKGLYTDSMLFSPSVVVFRAGENNLLPEPFATGVFTLAAPDLRRWSPEARVPHREVQEAVQRRLEMLLDYAALKGIRHLVLGAWGCGAFCHDPVEMAALTRRVLVESGRSRNFETIAFAIKGPADGANIRAFEKAFAPELRASGIRSGGQ